MKTKILVSVVVLASIVLFEVFRPRAVLTPPVNSATVTSAATSIVAKADVSANIAKAAASRLVAGNQQIPLLSPTNPAFSPEIKGLSMGYALVLSYYGKTHSLSGQDVDKIATAMAVARMSQMLYEAEIATVTSADAKHVSIAIPVYADDAASLKDYLNNEVAQVTGSQGTDDQLTGIMDGCLQHFGSYPQTLDFSKSDTTSSKGEPVYVIKQVMDMSASNHGITAGTSLLTKSMLTDYAVFSDWLPKT
jgi:hypothetical protein